MASYPDDADNPRVDVGAYPTSKDFITDGARMTAKKPEIKIVMVETGDWECVYIDDTLAIEGHSIDARDLCRVLKLHGLIEFSGQRIEKPDDWFSPNAPAIYEE